jgi:hypothetical protein
MCVSRRSKWPGAAGRLAPMSLRSDAGSNQWGGGENRDHVERVNRAGSRQFDPHRRRPSDVIACGRSADACDAVAGGHSGTSPGTMKILLAPKFP